MDRYIDTHKHSNKYCNPHCACMRVRVNKVPNGTVMTMTYSSSVEMDSITGEATSMERYLGLLMLDITTDVA